MGEKIPMRHADERRTRGSAALDALAADWTRLGVLFAVEPSPAPVDVERLIVATARAAPDDERLFVCAASWLAEHHRFVDGQRLSALAADLDARTSAVLGAMLSVAGGETESPSELQAARSRCRPLPDPQPLFNVTASMRMLRDRAQRDALPVFASWGLWHDDATLKPSAIRPESWLLREVPGLFARFSPSGPERPDRLDP